MMLFNYLNKYFLDKNLPLRIGGSGNHCKLTIYSINKITKNINRVRFSIKAIIKSGNHYELTTLYHRIINAIIHSGKFYCIKFDNDVFFGEVLISNSLDA